MLHIARRGVEWESIAAQHDQGVQRAWPVILVVELRLDSRNLRLARKIWRKVRCTTRISPKITSVDWDTERLAMFVQCHC